MKISEIIIESLLVDINFSESQEETEIHNYQKLDYILTKLCQLVIQGRRTNPEKYGMVGAAILDPKNRIVTGTSVKVRDKWCHAERHAIMKYLKLHGVIPQGSILLTTCSPCSEHMSDRYGEDCTQFIEESGVMKVYTGHMDSTQPENHRSFNIMVTANESLREFCRKLSATFEDW